MNSCISFPALGINIYADNVAFSVGGKDIYWYGIIIALGFTVAIITALHLAKKYGMKSDTIIDIVIFGAPIAILCARLYYVIFEWDYYSKHPGDIIKIWNGGLAIYGAILSAVLVAFIYCRIKKENFLLFADFGGIGLAIGQCIGRWGNFFNQEAFGTNTTLPWGMTGNEIKAELLRMASQGMDVDAQIPVHPTFLYESLWNLVFIITALCLFHKRKFDGQVFLSYLIYYGTGRFFIESLRTDSLYLGVFRVSQLVAVGCVLTGIFLMVFMLRKKERKLTCAIDSRQIAEA